MTSNLAILMYNNWNVHMNYSIKIKEEIPKNVNDVKLSNTYV